ncbi:MAG: FAD-dependent oxidoreductase, partial [Pseudorhodoplanes sp.]
MPEQVVDVVVVGGGGAGLFAAYAAARAGAKTVLLEKTDVVGGATSQSIGLFAASGSSLQAKRGIQDDPEAHCRDALAAGKRLSGTDNPELTRLLADHAGETMRELEELGVVFFGPMPHPEQSRDRIHGVLPNASSYIYHLQRAAWRAGVEIRTNAPVAKLLTEGDRVIGVQLGTPEAARFIARRGVILASGDFSSDPVLKQNHCNLATAAIEGLVCQNTGDGHRLALSLGAEIVNGNLVNGPHLRFVPPKINFVTSLPPWSWLTRLMRWSLEHMPAWLLRPFLMMFLTSTLGPEKDLFKHGAILVNQHGERFTDEMAQPEFVIPTQPGKLAYILFDDRLASQFNAWPHFVSTAPGVAYAYVADYRRNRRDLYHRASNVPELARRIGVPLRALQATLDAYRRERPGGISAEGGLHALGPLKSWLLVTEGGVRVSTRLEVLKGGGKPIPGLYAA